MCKRVQSRVAFGKPLAEQGTIRADIANSRIEIDQARLLTLAAAYKMDTAGNKAARAEIAMIKVVAPNVALQVLDRAIQAHGGAGVSQDTFLAEAWATCARCGSPMDPTKCTSKPSPNSNSENFRSRRGSQPTLNTMPPIVLETLQSLKNYVGREIATTDWFLVTQDRIRQFAEATKTASGFMSIPNEPA